MWAASLYRRIVVLVRGLDDRSGFELLVEFSDQNEKKRHNSRTSESGLDIGENNELAG
jgi:hypothetical protein